MHSLLLRIRKAVSRVFLQDARTMKLRRNQAVAGLRLDPHLLVASIGAVPVWLLVASGLAGPVYHPAGVLAWLTFVLWQPLLEEWVFRGLLQGELSQRMGSGSLAGISFANALTTLCFVLVHLVHQPAMWAVAVALPSLVLGHLRERLASVWPAAALHSLYNAGFGLAAWFALRSGLGS
ncbi:MAG: hypothetical protein RL459_2142 [Pseudomonadota bacterium]